MSVNPPEEWGAAPSPSDFFCCFLCGWTPRSVLYSKDARGNTQITIQCHGDLKVYRIPLPFRHWEDHGRHAHYAIREYLSKAVPGGLVFVPEELQGFSAEDLRKSMEAARRLNQPALTSDEVVSHAFRLMAPMYCNDWRWIFGNHKEPE